MITFVNWLFNAILMDSESYPFHKRDNESTEDYFKPIFKKYKSREVKVDLSKIIDFNLVDVCEKFGVSNHHVKLQHDSEISDGLGLKPVKDWKCFTLTASPGFIFIRNPFKYGHQRYWLKRLLQDIPCPTNKTNLTGGLSIDRESIWKLHNQRSTGSAYSKLRWVTLGYHYNWSTKLYDPEDRSPFPDDIGLLSRFVAASLGFDEFKAEAAIVNYYNMSSTLGGHNDHSELDHDAPLFSFSFGQSAIFLVGGLTKAVTPTPVLLRSGDIIILSSLSRLAFHGVPRILHDSPENLSLCWGIDAGEEGISNSSYNPGNNKNDEANGQNELITVRSVTMEETIQSCQKTDHSCDNVRDKSDSFMNSQTKTITALPSDINLLEKENSCTSVEKIVSVSPNVNVHGFTNDGSVLESIKRLSESQIPCSEDSVIKNLNIKRSKVEGATSLNTCLFRRTIPNYNIILQRIRNEMVELSKSTCWDPFEKYLQNARLNLSIRQVNMRDTKGMKPLEDMYEDVC